MITLSALPDPITLAEAAEVEPGKWKWQLPAPREMGWAIFRHDIFSIDPRLDLLGTSGHGFFPADPPPLHLIGRIAWFASEEEASREMERTGLGDFAAQLYKDTLEPVFLQGGSAC